MIELCINSEIWNIKNVKSKNKILKNVDVLRLTNNEGYVIQTVKMENGLEKM